MQTCQTGNPAIEMVCAGDEPGAQRLVCAYDAVPESVPRLRSATVALAQAAGADATHIDAIRLAVSEALSNVVLHAYGDRPGRIYVTAVVTGDELWVLIGDDGRGLQVRSERPGLGWGLRLIATCADYFEAIERAEGGTELRMRFRLEGEPAMAQRQPERSAA